MAEIVYNRFALHLPYYRQSEMFARLDTSLSRLSEIAEDSQSAHQDLAAMRSEFAWSPEETDRATKWAALAGELHTNMHEVIGHGSRKHVPMFATFFIFILASLANWAMKSLFGVLSPVSRKGGDAGTSYVAGLLSGGEDAVLKKIEKNKKRIWE